MQSFWLKGLNFPLAKYKNVLQDSFLKNFIFLKLDRAKYRRFVASNGRWSLRAHANLPPASVNAPVRHYLLAAVYYVR